jgi:hypothetical protein
MNVWKSSGIDFINILNLHHTEIGQTKYPVQLVLKSFVDDVIIFLLSFILFNKVIRGSHQGQYRLAVAHVIPVLLTVYYCYRVVQPFDSRKSWLFLLWKSIAAPLYPVEFVDGYIGDLLTSLVRVSVPFLFSILYVILSIISWLTNNLDWAMTTSQLWWTEYKFLNSFVIPVLMLYPLWIRLFQCLRRAVETGNRWPHYGNALKYTTALLVISYGSFQPTLRGNPLWIGCFVFATVYQFLWDLFQDWGMIEVHGFDPSSYSNLFQALNDLSNNYLKISFSFRSKRLIGSIWVYYFVIVFNLAFRFAWTLTLLPPISPTEHGFSLFSMFMYHVSTLIAALEIIRRMIWGFFRLEWEQIELMRKSNLEFLSPTVPAAVDDVKGTLKHRKNSGSDNEDEEDIEDGDVDVVYDEDDHLVGSNLRRIELDSYDKVSSFSFSNYIFSLSF